MAPRQPYRPASERKADIVDATVTLLAERGPSALTLREIGQRAGVPHTVIVRHFGDKAGLIRAATLGELLRWAEVVRGEHDAVTAFVAGFRFLCEHPRTGAAVGLAVAGTARPSFEVDQFPVVDAHVELLVAQGMPARRARDLSMAAIALIAAWVVAEDWWVTVSRYRGSRARQRARRAIETQLRTMVEAGLAREVGTPRP